MRTNLISIVPVSKSPCKSPAAEPPEPRSNVRPAAHVVESSELLQGRDEVVIVHNGREYRLRLTRLGKLILTA